MGAGHELLFYDAAGLSVGGIVKELLKEDIRVIKVGCVSS